MINNVSDSEERERADNEPMVALAEDASSDSPATSSNDEDEPMEQHQQQQQMTKSMGEDDEEEVEQSAVPTRIELASNSGEQARADNEPMAPAEDASSDSPATSSNDEDEPMEQQQQQQQQMTKSMEENNEEEEEGEESAGPTRIDMEIARCRASLGEEGPFFVKMPNFLNVVSKKFDPATYEDEMEEDDVLDEEGRQTRLKVKMENTIRWRIVQDSQGNEKRESNAKIVRWSDGSMSLYLGKEIFEIEKQRLMDHNHLYTRQGTALQAQAIFRDKLIFRPHSTETMTHRKMTLNMAEKTNKAQKVKVLAQVGDNPEAERRELIRTEEEKLRAAARREAQQRRIRERPRATGLTPGFLEGYESDEGGESLAAIKRRYQHAPYSAGGGGHEGGASGAGGRRSSMAGGGGLSSDESAEEEERERRARKAINEAKIYSDDEWEEGGAEAANAGAAGDDSETEQQQTHSSRHQTPQQKKKIVIEEDEED